MHSNARENVSPPTEGKGQLNSNPNYAQCSSLLTATRSIHFLLLQPSPYRLAVTALATGKLQGTGDSVNQTSSRQPFGSHGPPVGAAEQNDPSAALVSTEQGRHISAYIQLCEPQLPHHCLPGPSASQSAVPVPAPEACWAPEQGGL